MDNEKTRVIRRRMKPSMKYYKVVALVAILLAVQLSSVQATCNYNGVDYPVGAKMDTFVLGHDFCQSVYCTNGNQEWQTGACQKRSVNPFNLKARTVPPKSATLIKKILDTFRNLQ